MISLFSFLTGMPTVSVGSSYYNTTYGKQVILECKIAAYPPVTLVYWQRKIGDDITTLNEGTIGTKGISADMPSLVLMFATTSDSGIYTCFASNRAGTQKSLEAILIVEGGTYLIIKFRTLPPSAIFGTFFHN